MLIMVRRRWISMALFTAVVLAGAVPAMSVAARGPGLEVTQALYDRAGQPAVGANFVPDGHMATPTWWICQPGSACVQGSSTGWLTSVPVAAGTTFEARAEYQGVAYVVRSPVWNGPLAPVTRPALKGPPIVGRTLHPTGAHWSGGWDRPGDSSYLHVEACRTVTALRCVTLSAQGEDYPGSGIAPVVGARYVGWYLFATDSRYSKDSLFAGVGSAAAGLVPPVEAGPTVIRSRPYGPVRRH